MVVSDWRISILAIQAGCNLLLCGLDRNLNRKLLGPYEDINVGRGKKKKKKKRICSNAVATR